MPRMHRSGATCRAASFDAQTMPCLHLQRQQALLRPWQPAAMQGRDASCEQRPRQQQTNWFS